MKNIQELVFSPFTILVWSLILLNNLQYVYSQNEALKFEHYSIAQGISSPVISCILRDHEGYMWFGTFNSIEKYDGYSFTSYKNVPGEINSLNNGYGQTIYEDKIGNIWVGTSQGLDKFNRSNGNFTHYFPNEREINIEGKNHVWAICEDKIGQLWISAGGHYIL